ncbi:MAG: Zn-ribbon domain-containing OB-fold protein [Halobacteriales archaeon]
MSLEASRCENGHLHYPRHSRCRDCGGEVVEAVDLTERVGEVVTWTVATSVPPGVREPNPLAIVAFDVDGDGVRVIGGLTTTAVETGDRVEAVHVDELRDPAAGIRVAASQAWDGYRFRPVIE